ncbi:Glycosyltransferase [Archaeoglobus sulfaticallidus PM70-1]|uniref:Glycosyltransferase n=1 Tax=Archaeoglobus sulfaticallidus PM70-1 TaxID=387631 RepID=N0BAP7_9EURY|nr:glycosyltransferase family 4 protein [Archaeoglobus sulfaticallidus]AGK60063.1 Glycosyltransferase [Archaeoglobus sulfaticallidus PM70-1]
MKIAMVTAFWGPAYPTGSGIYAYEVARRLADQGNEVHVYTSSVGNFDKVEYPDNFHIHVLRAYTVVWNMNPFANVFTKLLSKDFDIVHVHSYIFFMSNMTALARIFKNFKYVLHFHGGLNYSEAKKFHPWRTWAKENIYDKTLGLLTVKIADKVLSVAKSDIPIIKRKFGVDAEWIPNCVCTEKFSYSENDSRVVTYVGKLEKWKGAELLKDVFKTIHNELEDVKFMVVGDGSLAEKLKNSNLPIKLMGHVPHDKMPDIYHKTAVSVLPSYMEGLPTICMESLACGVPVVATDVGDTREIVTDGKTGFLVKPGDAKAMASKVIELLEDDDLRKTMGREGRRHVEENFSYDVIVERVYEVYSSLI